MTISREPDRQAVGNRRKFYKKSPDQSLPAVAELAQGVLSGGRKELAQAITLVESNALSHGELAQSLLQQLLPFSGSSIRIGITGVPGAGKSTFIDAFGMHLCMKGIKVAVLAVDPSSKRSGGSILGDKTRMERLSRHPLAFVRPSPTGGKLGGVTRKTKETICLCEAAGYEVILIETVGVGQSEVMVRDMVDFFMLLVLTGAGDELQGMKKGIMELADAIVVNKADGENEPLARRTKEEYNQILHFLQPATKGWQTKASTCSSMKETGLAELWDLVRAFHNQTLESGVFHERRREQMKEWLKAMIADQLEQVFYSHPLVKESLPTVEREMLDGKTTLTQAVNRLFHAFYKH